MTLTEGAGDLAFRTVGMATTTTRRSTNEAHRAHRRWRPLPPVRRRRTFAIASALGAKGRQLGGFVWAEALFVTAGGLSAGALGGWVLSHMLVKVLTGVFDPPPAALAVPWSYLITVGGVTVAATALAAIGAIRVTRRPATAVIRDL